jgi:hypothetical protein
VVVRIETRMLFRMLQSGAALFIGTEQDGGAL